MSSIYEPTTLSRSSALLFFSPPKPLRRVSVGTHFAGSLFSSNLSHVSEISRKKFFISHFCNIFLRIFLITSLYHYTCKNDLTVSFHCILFNPFKKQTPDVWSSVRSFACFPHVTRCAGLPWVPYSNKTSHAALARHGSSFYFCLRPSTIRRTMSKPLLTAMVRMRSRSRQPPSLRTQTSSP